MNRLTTIWVLGNVFPDETREIPQGRFAEQ
jgi:hypothetical protein